MRNLPLYDLSIKPRQKGLGTTQGQSIVLMLTFFGGMAMVSITRAGWLGYVVVVLMVVLVFFAARKLEQLLPARAAQHYYKWINSKDLYKPGREKENPPQVLFKE